MFFEINISLASSSNRERHAFWHQEKMQMQEPYLSKLTGNSDIRDVSDTRTSVSKAKTGSVLVASDKETKCN